MSGNLVKHSLRSRKKNFDKYQFPRSSYSNNRILQNKFFPCVSCQAPWPSIHQLDEKIILKKYEPLIITIAITIFFWNKLFPCVSTAFWFIWISFNESGNLAKHSLTCGKKNFEKISIPYQVIAITVFFERELFQCVSTAFWYI